MLLLGIAALLFVAIGVFTPHLSNTGRAVLMGIGLVCGILFVLVVWAAMQMFAVYQYQALAATDLKKMELVARMNDRQLEALDTHDIRVEMRPTPKGCKPVWIGGNMEFEREDIVFWLKETLRTYPDLPKQHGLTGWQGEEREYRDELAAFTSLVCGAGLASWPSGNQGAKWLVKASEVPDYLGVAKEL